MGGALERLAERIGVRRRFTVAADGRFAEWEGGQAGARALDMADLFSEDAIRGHGQKINRYSERFS